MNVKALLTPRMQMVATVLAVITGQLACTEPLNFSPDAAISTFAPHGVPIVVTRDADVGTAQPSTELRHSRDRADNFGPIQHLRHFKGGAP